MSRLHRHGMVLEFAYLDRLEMSVDGRNGPILEPILDAPDVDREFALRAVENAKARGMSPEMAEHLYGLRVSGPTST